MVRARESIGRRSGGRLFKSPTLLAAILVTLVFWLLAGAGCAVDPYNVYPWGAQVRLRSNYQPDEAGYLTWMAARDPQADVVLVGASTALFYTPEVIRAAFPQARSVWNLSYNAARPADRDMILKLLSQQGHAKRIIVMLDWFYAADAVSAAPNFPASLYDDNPINDLRLTSGRLPAVLWATLHRGEPFPTGKGVENGIARRFAEQYQSNRSPAVRSSWAAAIARERPRIDRAGRTSCAELRPLHQQLLPVLRQLAAKGVQVDILLPAYSPVMYYTFLERTDHVPIDRRSFFEDQLLLRRCAVTETAGLRSVAVWAPDRDFGLISDIRNFKDPGHLAWGPEAQVTLRRIGDPRFHLTLDNVGDYVDRMRALVLNYRLSGSPSEK